MAFFYGWTNEQLQQLDVDEFNDYWHAITIIEAQEQLKRLSVADWPNLKKQSREKQHRQLHKDAYPASFNEVKQINNADLAKILGGTLG